MSSKIYYGWHFSGVIDEAGNPSEFLKYYHLTYSNDVNNVIISYLDEINFKDSRGQPVFFSYLVKDNHFIFHEIFDDIEIIKKLLILC